MSFDHDKLNERQKAYFLPDREVERRLQLILDSGRVTDYSRACLERVVHDFRRARTRDNSLDRAAKFFRRCARTCQSASKAWKKRS